MTLSNNGESTTLRVGAARHTNAGVIRFARYQSGETAIEILDEDRERQITATVAVVPYGAPHPGEYGVWLKGWSENEGVPDALVAAGIVTLTGRTSGNGRCDAQHALLTDTARAVFINHLATQRAANADRVYREIDELTNLHVFSPDRARTLKDSLTASVIDQCLGIAMSIRELIDLYDELAVERRSPNRHQFPQQG